MKIGLSGTVTSYSVDAATLAKKAEDLGFESLWVGEHPVIPVHTNTPHPIARDGTIPEFYSHWADPLVTLTAAATATSKIKLGTSICLAHMHRLFILAKQVASLDHFSGGRVIFGVGAGWLREEAELLGVDFSKRWLLLRETVAALRVLWTQDPAEYHGKLVDFPPVHTFPKPVQQPIPILLGAHGLKNLERVVRWADGWTAVGFSPRWIKKNVQTLKGLAESAGRDPANLIINVSVGVTRSTPVTEVLEQYQEAGVTRINLSVAGLEGPQSVTDLHYFRPGEMEEVLEWLASSCGDALK